MGSAKEVADQTPPELETLTKMLTGKVLPDSQGIATNISLEKTLCSPLAFTAVVA